MDCMKYHGKNFFQDIIHMKFIRGNLCSYNTKPRNVLTFVVKPVT